MNALKHGFELVSDDDIEAYVKQQRWFGGNALEVASVRVVDQAAIREEAPALLDLLVEIRYGTGTHDLYQVVLGLTDGQDVRQVAITSSNGITAYDAVSDPTFVQTLFDHCREGVTLPSAEGTIEFSSVGPPATPPIPLDLVRPVAAEQTNSSVVVDERLIVKAYRRLEAGENPELELLRFFAAHDFANVPRLEGWWDYRGPLLDASLGIVQQFVENAVDGWSLALEELPRESDRFLGRIEQLGSVIGAMHAVLASDSTDPAFCSEDASQESLALLLATVDEQIDDVFGDLPDDEVVAPIAGRGDALRSLLRGTSSVGSVGKRIRQHGDLHLGQVLWAAGDWLVIDFEGEPARRLPERRLKSSPLRDIAGMLRSFTYATCVADVEDDTVEERARASFLEGYFAAMADSGVLPPRETAMRLVRIFELEKAIYELRYELAHRPDWVSVPVRGIARLLEEDS